MNDSDRQNQRKGTLRSIVDVDGAVVMEQIVNFHPMGGARLVTTRWLDLAHRVLRQDECVLVDPNPPIGLRA